MPDFISLTGISKHFGGVTALADVDMTIGAGEVHCLAGENGSGKSTLIKIISGVQPPDAGGEIVIDGRLYTHLTPAESTRIGIQVIYQDLSLFPDLTVAENIAFAQHLRGFRGAGQRRLRSRAEAVVARLGVALDLDALVGELSIAQRQLVAICRALAAEARLVIMDEPTASLTRTEVDTLLDITRELKRRGIAVVFVSHRLDEVMEIAERVTVLRDGRKLGTWDAQDMTPRRLGSLMTGHEFDYKVVVPDLSQAPVVLSVKALSRRGDFQDVSLDIRQGEILGVIGLLGSGRTELALSLFGMRPADQGEIRMDGAPVHLTSNRAAIDHGIAYVSEDRLSLGLVLEQPIASNIVLSTLDKLKGAGGLLSADRRRQAVRQGIEQLGIKVSDPENPVRTLSGGNQQRVVIAKWLATQPRVLILDSPTVGVDINAKDGIYAIVKRLAAEGMAVMMISDEIPEVLYHAHRILVMQGGRVKGEFHPADITETALREAIDA
ncbi:sugar ABC transporter ATP-binding protein [Acidisoma silvae]|uniref:Sugar ABC transporter ATP-binding protein n=1 Tax=Acidisoma silvae TaxID=2802396 RepID=A0A963YPP4_9PROT|nr:sugar ABC transporter ATP-binding protein [Acidisoma silvae]MCB8874522.1 sugar ABC transporter ATP-binding protein [Acidisoma silvae]